MREAYRRISAGRKLRPQRRGKYQNVPGDPGAAFQHSRRLCDGVCGADFLRGNRSSVSCKESIWNIKTDRGYTGNVLYGSCVLYDL